MLCPDDDTLIALVEAALPPARLEAIEAHVDECPSCRKVIASLATVGPVKQQLALGTAPTAPLGDQLARGTMVTDRYRIERAIGRGGMGAVYLARDVTLDRDVAVKLHHAGSGNERLYQEALAMAKLAHPNVVNVFEIGVVDERRFVAMEYVTGGTSRDWLARPRTWAEIVELFAEAGEGLVAAHQAGLVHRDFKPENVLVGEDGRPRVSDFGLVRTHASGEQPCELDTPITSLTETGAILGTPAYMAPEQFAGVVVDARCDQFSFCVTVWEALYRSRPFSGATLAEILDAIERRELRAATETKVPPRVRRVLERGLATDPADRYPGMAELLGALRSAAAPRRIKRWIAVAAIAVLALGGGGAALGYSRGSREVLARCPKPPQIWDASRGAAIERAFTATGLPYAAATWTNAQHALERWASRWEAQQHAACVAFDVQHGEEAALHDRREACLERARIGFAAIVDRLAETDRTRLAQTQRLVGSLPDLDVCARAEVDTEIVDPARRQKLDAYLGELALTSSLTYAGRYDEALGHIDALVRAAKELGSRRDEAEVAYLAGQLQVRRSDYEAAAKTYETALWTAEGAADDVLVAALATDLMDVLGNDLARYPDAQKYRELAHAAAERIGTTERRSRVLQVIGRNELAAGHYDAADQALHAALAMLEKDPIDPTNTASVLTDLGMLATSRSQPTQAEPVERRCLEIYTKELGAEHPTTLSAADNLATTLQELGRYDEAREINERTLAIWERVSGPNSTDVAYALDAVGVTQTQAGDYDKARASEERALAIFQANLDPTHPNIAHVLANLGQIAFYQNRLGDAAALQKRALEARRQRLGPHHPDVARSLLALSDIAFTSRDYAGQLVWCKQARDVLAGSDADNAELLAMIGTCEGAAELRLGHAAKAVEVLEPAVAALETPDADPGLRAASEFALAQALPASARARALDLAHRARTAFEHEGGFAKDQLANVDEWLRAHEH